MTTPLETATGALHFDDLDLVVEPALTRSAFEAHEDSARFERGVGREPFASFMADATLDDERFAVVVFFEGERLTRVSLTIGDPALTGTSWADYDPGRARRGHDAWFDEHVGGGEARGGPVVGGVERRFAWGTVGSQVHPQDGAASITIAYAG